jgi:hypothetical protein
MEETHKYESIGIDWAITGTDKSVEIIMHADGSIEELTPELIKAWAFEEIKEQPFF